jgi:hypothetical protein
VYWCASNKGSVLFMKQNFIKCFGGKISKLQMYIYNKVCERLYTIFFKNFLYGHSLLVMQLTTYDSVCDPTFGDLSHTLYNASKKLISWKLNFEYTSLSIKREH